MSFPRYPNYQNSGVAWLGWVPSHWDVRRLGGLFTERREKVSDTEFPPLSVTKRGIVPQLETAAKTDDNDNRKCVLTGDFVINSRSDRKGSSGLSLLDGSVSLINTVIKPDDRLEPAFVHYLLRSGPFQEEFYRYGKGIVADLWSTNYAEMKNIVLAYPSRTEQAAIAAFLDRETAKIDALVEEQRRLIALLKEKRQAVISHAVTKGLTPDAPMKDSGVEWLGEVPAHWEVTRIKHVARMESGHTPDRKVAAYWEDCNIPWVSLHDTAYLKDNDYISTTAQNINALGVDNSSARLLPSGVVVFSRDATIGRCAITTCEMAVSQHFIAWVCGKGIVPEFLLLCLRSMTEELDRLTSGATLKTIGMPDVRTLTIAVPASSEQQAIVSAARRSAERIDHLIHEVEEALSLLQERRTALISAAVTGKIDVRGSAEVLRLPAGRARARGLTATEIIERSARQATFGRVKLQKLAYLAEAHVGVTELEGNYLREAAGPLDRDMIHEMEREAGALAGVRVEQPDGAGSAVTYRLGDRPGAHRKDLAALLGDRVARFDKLVEDISTIETKGAEAVATLYAVWNDALIDGDTPADMEIKLAVLSEWHPEKAEKFTINDLQIWLDWMRRHGLVPTGAGPKTTTGRLFA